MIEERVWNQSGLSPNSDSAPGGDLCVPQASAVSPVKGNCPDFIPLLREWKEYGPSGAFS